MLFYYVSAMTLGVGCLAVHGHRVTSSRHVIAPCVTTSPRDQLRKEGSPLCAAVLCGGSVPRESHGDQGPLERVPRLLLVRLTGSLAARLVVVVLYLAVLGASVYGVISLKLGVELKALVAPSSHIHDYLVTDSKYFGFSFPVVFVMDEGVDYNRATANLTAELLLKARRDPGIDKDFVRCWVTDFFNSSHRNRTGEEGEEEDDFRVKVVEEFLLDSETFTGDVVLDEAGERILASRCYVFTEKNSDPEELTALMLRMRGLAEEAGFPVFAYHPAFLAYDRRLALLPQLFWAAGVAVAALCALFAVCFPDPVAAVVVVPAANCVSTLLGTLGFLHFLGVPVSFVSLPHLVLSAGFAVYFSAHVSAAYLQSPRASRADRVADAVSLAAAPVLGGALCVLVGVLLLLAAGSYSFAVLFKATLLTLLLALFHAAFLTPTLLSWIGREKSREEVDRDEAFRAALKRETKKKKKKKTLPAATVTANGRHVKRSGRGDLGEESPGSIVRGGGLTTPKTRDSGHGIANGKSWPHYFQSINSTSALTTSIPDVIGNGTAAAAEQNRSGKKRPNGKLRSSVGRPAPPLSASTEAPPDYENTRVEQLRHSLASNHYEPIGPGPQSVSSAGDGRPRLPDTHKAGTSQSQSRAASVQYENWPPLAGRTRGSTGRAADLYDRGPLTLPPSRGRAGQKRPGPQPFVVNADYLHLRPLAQGSAPRQKKGMSSSPKAATGENAALDDAEAKEPQSPRQSKKPKGLGDAETDIVATLGRMDEACGVEDPSQKDSVTSLEGVHHVACTLSTNGALASTQAYVTENFGDIPS